MPGADSRVSALEWAELLRSVRASVCDQLAAGSVDLPEVLEARSDPAVGDIALLSVLESLPGARKIDTRRALSALGVPERVRLRDLGPEELEAVLAHFGGDLGAPG